MSRLPGPLVDRLLKYRKFQLSADIEKNPGTTPYTLGTFRSDYDYEYEYDF